MTRGGEGFSLDDAPWITNRGTGKGYSLRMRDRKLLAEIRCIGKGRLRIDFRGACIQDENGNTLPYLFRIKHCVINGEEQLKESVNFWHDEPYAYTKKVEDGERVKVEVEWEPF